MTDNCPKGKTTTATSTSTKTVQTKRRTTKEPCGHNYKKTEKERKISTQKKKEKNNYDY